MADHPSLRRPCLPILALAVAVAASLPLSGGRKHRPRAKLEIKEIPAARRVNGYDLKPGADLRGADLREADLRGCDLTGADLRGADCRGARFEGTLLTGADLRHAKLFYAVLSGAVGADLTGAELHPFFALPASERVGDLDFLRTRMPGDPPGGPPTALACSAGGTLVWHGDPGSPPRLITPTGSRMVFTQDLKATVTVAGDACNRLWVFARGTTHVLDMARLDQAAGEGAVACKSLNFKLAEPPTALVPDEAGGLWLTRPPTVAQLSLKDGRGVAYESWKINGDILGGQQACLATLATTGHQALVDPSQDRVLIHYPAEQNWSLLQLPRGSRPRRVVPGPGLGFTFLQSQPGAIGLVGLRDDACELFRLPAAGVAREPWAVAKGPDGNLWFTDRGAGRIGRLSPERTWEEFQLPPGLRPLELVAGHDGRMYFTLEGRHRIGAIVAVPRAEPKGEPAAAPDTPATARRPERRKALTRAERHALLEARLAKAEARRLAREAKEADGTAQEAPPAIETKAEVKEASGKDAEEAPPSPLERLAALGVYLTPGATRHILARHGHGRDPGRSQFDPRFSHREGLEELLAKGLEACGTLGRVRCSDQAGRCLTLCRQEAAGSLMQRGKPVPTSQYVVVTARYDGDEGEEHVILTAYPVAEDW